MSCCQPQALRGEKVSDLTLEGNHILTGTLIRDNDTPRKATLDLDNCIANINGKFDWGHNFSKSARDVSFNPETLELKATLQRRDGSWTETPAVLQLESNFFNVNGHIYYLARPDPVISTPSLDLDGNVDASCFAVASDGPRNHCRIAYKTNLDEKISLAEVGFDGRNWGLPTQIDVYPGTVPGQNITFTYHPEPEYRSLFFSEENGNGYIYQQTYDPEKKLWDRPVTLRANKKARQDDGAKAHRFSKFCSTYYAGQTGVKALLVYYIDESNNLQESVGVQSDPKNPKKWYWKQTTLLHALPPKTFLAVAQRGETTLLVYRNEEDDICLIQGNGRRQSGLANWTDPTTIVKAAELKTKNELIKNSPLAICTRHMGKLVTIFFLKRHGREKVLFSIDYIPNSTIRYKEKRVGKLEPNSLIGAASFHTNPAFDARQFSVSCLDGDNILVERVPKYFPATAGGQQWVLSGGVVDSDVDYIRDAEIRSHVDLEEED